MSRKLILIVSVIVVLTLLSACGPVPASPEPPPAVDVDTDGDQADPKDGSANQNAPEDQPPADNAEDTDGDTPAQPAEGFTPLPPIPQPIQIPSAGDRMLEGMYYPAKVDNAPVVILMHWANGTMDDWQVIAPWLQNRLDEVDVPRPGLQKYYNIKTFPPMPDEISFAVVVFNFGSFGGSPFGGDRESWLWDAIGALNYAASIEGVDPHRIAAMGASIGADGPVDACYLFNDAGEIGTCIGTLSLSPGNWLTEDFSYPEAASYIEMSGYPVWCLAAEGDYEAPALCSVLEGAHARSFIFSGKDHGMELLTGKQTFIEPPLGDEFTPIQVVQEFLETTFATPLNDYSIP